MITFSIITCTFNASSVLQRTLDSVMAQHYPAVEHLIQDGLSADGTLDMAQRYKTCSDQQSNGHRVDVVSEKDGGLYDAMNRGIKRANGDYVVFLNAGDTLPDADTLSRIADCAAEGNVLPGVLYGDTDIVDADGHFLRHRRLAPPDRLTWRSFRRGMLVCHQAFYARTDLARSTPYNLRYRYSADVDWCIHVMREAARLQLPLRRVPAVLVNYLDGGMTVQNHRASLRERFQVMRTHYGLFVTLIMHGWFMVRAVLKR